MHDEAAEFVAGHATVKPITVIEIGSRNINGTSRIWFPNARWTGLDILEGEMVDIVIDAEHYEPDELVDMVICCEVYEHAPRWKKILKASSQWLKPVGKMLITCAGPDRVPHSAIDGEHRLLDGEHYANISRSEIEEEMTKSGLISIKTSGNRQIDTYAVGFKS